MDSILLIAVVVVFAVVVAVFTDEGGPSGYGK